VSELDPFYDVRTRLVDALALDLAGPSPDDPTAETIEDPPLTRYIVGVVYPQSGEMIDPSQDVDVADDYDEVAVPDPPVAMANVRYPASMGMTFSVDPELAPTIVLRVEASRYEMLEEEPGGESDTIARSRRRSGAAVERWRRVLLDVEPEELRVTEPAENLTRPLAPGLELFCRVRRPDSAGAVPITVVLVNTNNVAPGRLRDADSFFQVRIAASASSGEPCFVERAGISPLADDEDVTAYRLLFRDAASFAVGHGTSVAWDRVDGTSRASLVRTSYLPTHELLLADSNADLRGRALTIRWLTTADRDDVVAHLHTFCDEYASWIEQRREEASGLSDDHRATAHDHLDVCAQAASRMKAGVDQLASKTDDTPWRAFRLANKAMLRQRSRVEWLRHGRPTEAPEETDRHEWRPFQLAFILLCLRGIADSESADREFADLLWFPTGGGKTEAYLGLIAFTVFLRRLRHGESGAGVNVLMRYTMRLLTIQQFERAALLICCLESLRREDPSLGTKEISIGLWVGRDATPNDRVQAGISLDRLRAGRSVEKENPVQLHACPWCGDPLDHRNYWLPADKSRVRIACRQTDCQFSGGLPAFVVDDDLYEFHPTLVVATADKYASLPWRERVAALFNLDDEGTRPPELIIQDELHLISGPLGTLTGLYETAVDLLCTHEGTPPKVVASTATIRRARQQTLGLFNREVRQFPPPAVDASNSYFAVEATRDEKATRLYAGVMAPGSSQTTLLVRVYACLLQTALELDVASELKDPYWTLVGYFNSLRVLGGARMQVTDDVSDRIELIAASGHDARQLEQRIELTSREPSSAIPEALRHMAVRHPDPAALDVILATNMISVGVDIDRLGLMVVMGQPQATSEYIQATSRVGRTRPGLIVTLFNAARSRDRSHYESFPTYHGTLYRQVESTSVTPFSSRARDRGLHAVVVALARMLDRDLRPNDGAGDEVAVRRAAEAAKRAVLDRVGDVAADELAATEKQIDELVDAWLDRAAQTPELVFSEYRNAEKSLLVDAALDDVDRQGAFGTLWSLRDVDRSSNLFEVRP
jgi:Helicase conserved C-terminal domain